MSDKTKYIAKRVLFVILMMLGILSWWHVIYLATGYAGIYITLGICFIASIVFLIGERFDRLHKLQ